MIGFEVYINGKKVALAGATNLSVLSAVINAMGRLGCKTTFPGSGYDVFLNLGGMVDSKPRAKQLEWIDLEPLKVGDLVRIKILEVNVCDLPLEVDSESGV